MAFFDLANYKDHQCVAGEADAKNQALIDKGFSVGVRIELTKRITGMFGPKDERHDVAVGTTAQVSGYVSGRVICNFSVKCKDGKMHQRPTAVNPCNIKVAGGAPQDDEPKGVDDGATADKEIAPFPEYPFFLAKAGEDVKVIDDWANTSYPETNQWKFAALKGSISVGMELVWFPLVK